MNKASITTIEITAIQKAIEIAVDLGIQHPIIHTDSLSSCTILKHDKKETQIEGIVKNIYELGKKAKAEIWWIPAHVGILGNKWADRLPKQGTDSELTIKKGLGT